MAVVSENILKNIIRSIYWLKIIRPIKRREGHSRDNQRVGYIKLSDMWCFCCYPDSAAFEAAEIGEETEHRTATVHRFFFKLHKVVVLFTPRRKCHPSNVSWMDECMQLSG